MALTLYRKYRPQTFAEVIGQNHIKTTLQSELETDKLAHAYLFSGPRGLGKTTVARLLAKSVNCLKRKAGQSEPCNKCDACQEVIKAKSLDVIEIDAASHTGVDNVRENIIENSRFTPTSRKFKVFIIDEVHMLSTSAFNALLKTLEEPPAHAMFILATTEIHKVPETIVSRCQHFDFRKVTTAEIIQKLNHIIAQEGKKVNSEVVETIAYYGQGCLRDAESLLGQILSLPGKEITVQQAELILPRPQFDSALEFIELLNKKDSAASIALINRLVEEGVDLEKFTADLIEVFRKILLIKVSSQLSQFGGSLGQDLENKISEIAKDVSLKFLIQALDVLLAKKQELKFADIPQLPLELAVIEIIGIDDIDNNPPAGAGNLTALKINKVESKSAEKIDQPKKSSAKSHISLQQIKDKWHEVLIALKPHNQTLATTLKISQPSNVNSDGVLEIAIEHKFHQQKLNDIKNRQILEQVLAEIFGEKILIKAVVDGTANSDESLENLLDAFGGRVVD